MLIIAPNIVIDVRGYCYFWSFNFSSVLLHPGVIRILIIIKSILFNYENPVWLKNNGKSFSFQKHLATFSEQIVSFHCTYWVSKFAISFQILSVTYIKITKTNHRSLQCYKQFGQKSFKFIEMGEMYNSIHLRPILHSFLALKDTSHSCSTEY